MAQPKLKGTQVDTTEIVTHSANNIFIGNNSQEAGYLRFNDDIVCYFGTDSDVRAYWNNSEGTFYLGTMNGGTYFSLLTDNVARLQIDAAGSVRIGASASYMGGGTLNAAGGVYENGVRITTGLVLENTQSGNYQLVLSDANKLITSVDGTAQTFTVPPNSTVAFPTGTTIAFAQHGAGQLTIAAGGGVTILTEVGLKLNAPYAMASIVKTNTDSWRLSGSLKA